MRKVVAFIATFATVLVAGVAVAQMGLLPSSDEPSGLEAPDTLEFAFGDAEEPGPELTADHPKEEPAQEPVKDRTDALVEKDHETPAVEKEPVDEHMDEAPPAEETEEPVDHKDATAPIIEVLYPEPGQTFHEKTVVFEGITEPGARVFAGKYEADVNGDGGWRIVLVLSPGGNKATFTAVDTAGNEAIDWVKVNYEPPVETTKPPREEPVDWEFSAHQVYGSCSENPPYDVFWGTGKPGSGILVWSEYGAEDVRVNENGEWEIKVTFAEAPVGKTFLVKAKDQFGHVQKFEFTRLASDTTH